MQPFSLRELFDSTVGLDPQVRARFLSERCPDPQVRASIERLLQADASDCELFAGGAAAAAAAIGDADLARSLVPGRRLGPYELIAFLGEGGSSTVFRACREFEGVRQEVALKILRRGLYSPEARRQFRRERQALTQLKHPGIAHLIEGGIGDDGTAYIALDLIKGKPITDYVRECRLDLRQRLLLFVQVCRAVAAAHRALIVHRDLKPSNVLVTDDGRVKLLDFGIAKLLDGDDETQTQSTAFTPAYAAPEQRSAEAITTATDVYALGVLLGELLTGQRLANGDRGALSAQVSDEAAAGVLPASAGVTRRALRGDVDNIVLKAIQTEPERRYASAGALADDVEHMLDGKPVEAHPPSVWYRTQKFVARHRGSVAITATLLFAIIAALGVAMWQASVARQEMRRADAMHDFMVSAFVEAEPGSPREGPPRITEVVEKSIARARSDAGMNHQVRTELLSELGAVLRAQGHLASARDTLQWNYDQAGQDFGADAPLTIGAGRELLQTLILTADFEQARALADQLLTLAPARDIAMRAKLLTDSAQLASLQREMTRALADGNAAVALARKLVNPDVLAQALSEYGDAQFTAGDVSGSTLTGEEELALRTQQFGARHIAVSTAHANLARAYRRAGKLEMAEQHIQAALAIDAAVLPKDDLRQAVHLNALMMLRQDQRDYRAALEAAEEGLRIDRVAYGDDHPAVANDLNSVGMFHARLGDYGAATTALKDALQRSEAKLGADHFRTTRTRANYGFALVYAGDAAAGFAQIHRAIASLEAAPEQNFDEQAATLEKLGVLHLDRNEAGDALPLVDRIDVLLGKLKQLDAYWDGRAQTLRARALLALGRAAPAQAMLADAAVALAQSRHGDTELQVQVPLLQAMVARTLGDAALAQSFAQQGLARFAALRSPPQRLVGLAETVRAEVGAASH